MESRRNELLADVATVADSVVRDCGLPTDVAEQIGAAVADALAEHWGGQVITIPMDYFFRLAQRECLILEEHRKGATYADLAKRYNMTYSGLRRLVLRATIRDRVHRQRDLFGMEA